MEGWKFLPSRDFTPFWMSDEWTRIEIEEASAFPVDGEPGVVDPLLPAVEAPRSDKPRVDRYPVVYGPLHLYRLEPQHLDHPAWEKVKYRGPVIARAESPRHAGLLATYTFRGFAPGLESSDGLLHAPWVEGLCAIAPQPPSDAFPEIGPPEVLEPLASL
jgi:hypothetical protein